MLYREAVIKRIYELCNENNYTPNRLAELSAIPPTTLSEFLSSKTKNPSYMIIFKICKALNLELQEFYNKDYFKIDKLDY